MTHRMSLPYPRQEVVITPHGRVRLDPEAIDGASAQCLDLTIRESEGALLFYEDGIAFLADRGGEHVWLYKDIDSYSIRKSMMGLRKLTLVTNGGRVRFRIGDMLAANADCILTTRGADKK